MGAHKTRRPVLNELVLTEVLVFIELPSTCPHCIMDHHLTTESHAAVNFGRADIHPEQDKYNQTLSCLLPCLGVGLFSYYADQLTDVIYTECTMARPATTSPMPEQQLICYPRS
jgi:hypothetical protein